MAEQFQTNPTTTNGFSGINNSTKPYPSISNFFGLSKPIFFLVVVAGSFLITFICCTITLRFCCRFCTWFKKSEKEKVKALIPNDIKLLLQSEHVSTYGFGRIDFCLRYKLDSQRLEIKIIQVSELQIPIDGSLDPYVIVSTSSKSNKEEKKTKTKMSSKKPIFNQKFNFRILKSEFHDSSVTLKVMDYDRYGSDAVLGQLSLYIRDLDTNRICNECVEYSMTLEEGEDMHEGMGQICIVLQNSKAGLVVTVLEVKNLRIKEESNFKHAFVKVKYETLKADAKYKTRSIRETKKVPISNFPYFNELFIFESINVALSNCRLKIKVFISGRFKNSTCVGYVILGSGSSTQSGELHWESMLDNPRHPVAKWHSLTNPNIQD